MLFPCTAFPWTFPYLPLQMANLVQTLLVDGYISQTFRSRAAEQYFLNLLKSTSVPSHATLTYSEWEECSFFVQSVPPHIPALLSSPPRFWLLDRGIVDRGTVVPQRIWSPQSASDRRQHVEKAQLQMPVFFEGEDRRVGVSLLSSIDSRCYSLRDANIPAPLGHKSSTYIRIAWPGYKEFKRQVSTRELAGMHNPISMARFARHIGRTVDAFFQYREIDPECLDERRELWRIGSGGIQRSDMVIIGAVQVSAGSWMSILQLNHYIF
ncbi:hypothetical protein EI94DRAFT_1724552 [Lactarius quietus]|nr:hypothetical protein EI94DRAFT_1724552 [Lactarius quietus]